MNDGQGGVRLRVVVEGDVNPHLVAPALRARLAGGDWPAGAERTIADAVLHARDAGTAAEDRGGAPWR